MDPDFWRGRWAEGRIGFHEGRVNTFLARHAARFEGKRRVLVPLCGKSEDLAFLAARGDEVVGIELVEDAARAFFREHQLAPAERTVGDFRVLEARGVTIFVGDFFAARPAELGTFDALYDRAAVIALPKAMRARYAQVLRTLLPPGALGLIVTLEYPNDPGEGPPFAVFEADLRSLWAGAELELLEARAAGGRFADLGNAAQERCFLLKLPD
jgi:thiopurine S-methyltransferase